MTYIWLGQVWTSSGLGQTFHRGWISLAHCPWPKAHLSHRTDSGQRLDLVTLCTDTFWEMASQFLGNTSVASNPGPHESYSGKKGTKLTPYSAFFTRRKVTSFWSSGSSKTPQDLMHLDLQKDFLSILWKTLKKGSVWFPFFQNMTRGGWD